MSNTVDLIFGEKGGSTEMEIFQLSEHIKQLGVQRDPLTLARFIYTLEKRSVRHPSVDPQAFVHTLTTNWEEAGIQLLPIAQEKYEKGFKND